MSHPTAAFELGVLLVAILYTIYAWRRGGAFFGLMLPAIALYSFVAEVIAVRVTHNYYYAPFFLQVCGPPGTYSMGFCTIPNYCVPIAIPLAEAIIVFSILRTTDQLRPPWYARPFLDATIATNMDVIFDPVVSLNIWCGPDPRPSALGLGLWTWLLHPSDPGLWFGVPLNNYIAWWGSIFGFSVALRGVQAWFGLERGVLRHSFGTSLKMMLIVVVAALLTGGLVVVLVNLAFAAIDADAWRWAVTLALLFGSLALALPSRRSWRRDHPTQWSLLIGHGFFFVTALAFLVYHQLWRVHPWLLVVWLGTALVGLLYGAAPYSRHLRRPS